MSYKTLRDISEWVVSITFLAGIITGIFNLTLGGFTPAIWFLIATFALIMVICTEVSQIREHLEKNK